MKFEEALAELRKGKKIKRRNHENFVSIRSPIHTAVHLIDILNDLNDWEVMEEPGKTFPEIFEAFKEGKTIRRKSWYPKGFTGNNDRYIDTEDLLATDWEVVS